MVSMLRKLGKRILNRILKLSNVQPTSISLSTSFADGKSVLITGGNGHQAVATGIELAKQGARRITLACRRIEAGEEAADHIYRTLRDFHRTNKDSAQSLSLKHELLDSEHCNTEHEESEVEIIVKQLDLASLDSVWDFSANFLQEEKELHILINQAGTFGTGHYSPTVDGNEIVFQTNYLSHFLLTLNLLELLSRSGQARIINVVANHISTRMVCPKGFPIDNPAFNANSAQFSPIRAYAESKLALMLFTISLEKRLNCISPTTDDFKNKTSVFSVDPGVLRPESIQKLPSGMKFAIEPLLNCLFRKPGEEIIFCAAEPDLEMHSGSYMQNKISTSKGISGKMLNEDTAERLWRKSKVLTERRGHYPSKLASYPHFF